MEGYWMLFGLILATFGPLLFVPVIWALKRWLVAPWLLRRERPPDADVGYAAWLISALIVLAVVITSWLPGRIEFSRLAEQHCVPVIAERVVVPGFFRTTLYPHEAERFLGETEFAWIEGPDMYKAGRYFRYEKSSDGKTRRVDIESPGARYAASHDTTPLGNGITLTEKRVFERATSRELARAGSVVYMGGPLAFALGVYGMTHCPEPLSEAGRRAFDDFYYLELKALGGR